jgi:hypothetical protein
MILLLHFVNGFVDWEVSDIASFVKTPISRVVEGLATVLIRVRLASRTRHVSSAWLEGAEEQGGGGGARGRQACEWERDGAEILLNFLKWKLLTASRGLAMAKPFKAVKPIGPSHL